MVYIPSLKVVSEIHFPASKSADILLGHTLTTSISKIHLPYATCDQIIVSN
jgi:hypothetical protein